MDPFLPGDIPVMVLRFLAVNKCEASAFALIEEMPILKVHINPKPSRVSNSDYLKYLSRSSVHLGLKDMLTDYMNSKILVEEILEDDESELSFDGRESLLNKVKCVQEKLNASRITSSMTRSPTSSSQTSRAGPENSLEVKVDQFTNTDAYYECPTCCTNRQKIFTEFSCQTEDYVTTTEICCQTEDYVTTMTEIGCQTEEYTAVSCGMQDEIPMMFYKTLLNDDGLQHKIAQTINEHREQDPEEKDVAQKISSKESEIDKFLMEFLKDIPDDSNSNISSSIRDDQDLSVPSSFAEVENNLFREAEKVLFGGSSNVQESVATVPEKLQPSSRPNVPITAGTNVLPATTPDAGATPKTPNTSSSSIDSREQSDDSSSPGNFNPRRSPRHHPVKRITPTRIPASSQPNPVFNSSIQIETHMAKVGDVNTKVSVKKTIFEQSAWSKLNRRDITPKTEGLIKGSEKPEKLRVTRTQSDAVWTFASNEPHLDGQSSSVEKSIIPPVHLQKNKKDLQQTRMETIESYTHKRKAAPVKLTPEKAKNSDYNFIHVYHQDKVPSAKKNDPQNVDSSSPPKKTPVSTSDLQTVVLVTDACDANSTKQIFINDNSQSDVTPMQLLPPVDSRMCSSTDLQTISPTALHRLIASANKVIGFSTGPTANIINKKKSFSTPRKRKHIRNLTFATPPSLKAATPSPTVRDESCERKSRKHKATEDLLSTEFKSKKRLKWPGSDSDKKVVSPIPEVDSEKTPEPTRRQSKQSLMLPPLETFNQPQQVNTVHVPFGLSQPISQSESQHIITIEDPVPMPIPYPIPVPPQFSNEPDSSKSVDTVPTPSNRRSRSKQKSGQSETEKVSAVTTTPPTTTTTPITLSDQTLQMDTITFHSTFEPPPEVPIPKRKSRAKKKAPVEKVKLKSPNKSSTTVPPSIPDPHPVPQIPQQENAVFNTIPNPPVTTIPVPTTGYLHIHQNTVSIQKPVSETFLAPTPSKPAAAPPHSETSQQEPIIFNIVPAPLGFSEPTPIKNFAETGFLNISQIGFNCNSPLITPLKSLPPQVLNESHFTLPPTPRMIEDQDSNSNSTHSLKLQFFDGGLYPLNLLSSTPLKPGIPRTPGRGSSSSNSHSPIAPETLNTQVQGQAQPVTNISQSQSQIPPNITHPSAITTTIVPPIPVTSVPPVSTFTTPATTSSVPTTTAAAKSDGEVTSDDEEERPEKATTRYKSVPLLPRKPSPKTTPDPPKSQSRDEPRKSLGRSSSGSTVSSSPSRKASIVPPIPVTSVLPVATFTTPATTSSVPTTTTNAVPKSDGEVTSSDDEEERPGGLKKKEGRKERKGKKEKKGNKERKEKEERRRPEKATTHYKPRKPSPKTTPDPPKSQSRRDEPKKSLGRSSSGSTVSSSPSRKASGGRSSTSRENGKRLQSSIIVPASSTANYSQNPATHPYVKVQSNIKQTQGIDFQVGGIDKKLTISEQETLYSLLQIGGNTNALQQYHIPPNPERKENRPNTLESAQNNNCQILPHQKSTDEEPPSLAEKPQNLQPNTNLMNLIKFVHRKNPNQKNTSNPKNN